MHHSSMIVHVSDNGDGNRHNHNNLPLILAGWGRSLTAGRRVEFKAPLTTGLYLATVNRI
jgi:hypothetical protein